MGDPASFEEKAGELLVRFDREARVRAARAFSGTDLADSDRVERWIEGDGLIVSTGQQPGLFGGPLLTLYKAATAIRLAAALEERLNRPVLPVFWVASEDHDWAEVDHSWLPDAGNQLRRIQLGVEENSAERMLRSRVAGPSVGDALEELRAALPPSEFRDRWLVPCEAAYEANTSLSVAFRQVLLDWLGDRGLLVVDAGDPVIKEASADLLNSAIRQSEGHEALLSERAQALAVAGWGIQVPIIEGALNLFVDTEEGRQRVIRDANGGFRLRETDSPITVEELQTRIAESGQGSVSPNALLRPVVESSVFPVVATVLGPSELAYHAEIPPLFEAFGIEPPVLVPRASFVAIEGKIGKVLRKLDLSLQQLARPVHEIESLMAREALPEAAALALAQLRDSVKAGMDDLMAASVGVDPTLAGPIRSARSSALTSIDDAERKVLQAVKRTQAVALGQLTKARLHIRPLDRPQERVFSPLYLLARYDQEFLDLVLEGAGNHLRAVLDSSWSDRFPAKSNGSALTDLFPTESVPEFSEDAAAPPLPSLEG